MHSDDCLHSTASRKHNNLVRSDTKKGSNSPHQLAQVKFLETNGRKWIPGRPSYQLAETTYWQHWLEELLVAGEENWASSALCKTKWDVGHLSVQQHHQK